MTDEWRESIPEELREAPALKDVPDIGSLAKQFVDLQAHMGNTMSLPRQDWTDDEYVDWAGKVVEKSDGRVIIKPDLTKQEQSEQFFRSLGKPETADGYKVPEGVDLSGVPEDQLNAIRNRLHQANVTDVQWERMAQDIAADAAAAKEAREQEVNKNLDRLKLEWGENMEIKKLQVADKLKNLNCPTCFIDDLKADKLTPEMAVWVDKVTGQISGENRNVAGDPPGPAARTPHDIEAEISRLESRRRALGDTNVDRIEQTKIVEKQHQLRIERDKLL